MPAANDPLSPYSPAKPPSRSTRLISRRHTDLEILRVAENIQAGHLSDRAPLAEFEGLDLELMEAFNQLLDTLTAPIQNSTSALVQALQGRQPALLTSTGSGDLQQFQDAVNSAVAVLVRHSS